MKWIVEPTNTPVPLDGNHEVLNFPGFHQLFFFGEYHNHIKDFCQLYGIPATIV